MSNNMRYPLHEFTYSNNTEYRKCIRQVFNMNATVYNQKVQLLETSNNEVLDDETRDEISYDDNSASIVLDTIFDMTKQNTLFNTLYLDAAAKMISLDPSIGIAVLFSYDYFELFHKCIVVFIQNPVLFTIDCKEYIALYNYLNK